MNEPLHSHWTAAGSGASTASTWVGARTAISSREKGWHSWWFWCIGRPKWKTWNIMEMWWMEDPIPYGYIRLNHIDGRFGRNWAGSAFLNCKNFAKLVDWALSLRRLRFISLYQQKKLLTKPVNFHLWHVGPGAQYSHSKINVGSKGHLGPGPWSLNIFYHPLPLEKKSKTPELNLG